MSNSIRICGVHTCGVLRMEENMSINKCLYQKRKVSSQQFKFPLQETTKGQNKGKLRKEITEINEIEVGKKQGKKLMKRNSGSLK